MSLKELEKELVSEKQWFLKGEVKGNDRPNDSLIEIPNIEFLKPKKKEIDAELIDEETGDVVYDDLEQEFKKIVLYRIKQQLFDNDIFKKEKIELSDDFIDTNLNAELDTLAIKSDKALTEEYANDYAINSNFNTINVKKTEELAEKLWKKLNVLLNEFVVYNE